MAEFIAVLGSSGCGKATLLRTIAGFQKASAGVIRLSGRDVAGLAPEKRGMVMMIASIAAFILLVPSVLVMMVMERLLKADVLAKVGQ